ncbi:hypothetical protein [Halobacillus halophilus]|uniref:hypothetical protein n=1 Tax=Halobacillus halophilus TaxID=1570 RepID=UPI001CD2D343|nr:hypothetical protein [Halobacillus halophilus]MCA1011868.1 hypothetical protein [Halobacillus halophilus]
MNLKDRLITNGFDHIDILLIDDQGEQTTVPDITLHKVNNLEYKLYLQPETIQYHLDKEYPYFEAEQNSIDGREKTVKGYVLEWK